MGIYDTGIYTGDIGIYRGYRGIQVIQGFIGDT